MKSSAFLTLSLFLSSAVGFAQSSDPVDKNSSGAFAGAQLLFGQARKVGESSPGPAYLLLADLGYGMKRDTWNRIEMGVELGSGKASFKDKNYDIDVDLDLDLSMMLKAGYGYSLGDHAFGIFRAGLGIVQASYEGDAANNVTIDGGTASGVAAMLGWDAVIPASDSVDFLFGASFRIINLNFDDGPNDTGEFQLNIPAVNAGMRARF